MSLSFRIKERREQLNMSRNELASKIGVTPSAIANYENEVSSPKVELLYKLFDALDCDANYLYQDEMKDLTYKDKSTPEEFENIVKKYRFISKYSRSGQESIDFLLNREYEIAESLRSQREQITRLELSNSPKLYMSYYQRLASAGSGEYLFDDVPTDTIEVPVTKLSEQADFVVGVNGDSMEPTYSDGDKVYIKKMAEIPTGCIGLFTRGNECFIKELGVDKLISHNKIRGDIPASEDIRLVGKVLGRVDEFEV